MGPLTNPFANCPNCGAELVHDITYKNGTKLKCFKCGEEYEWK